MAWLTTLEFTDLYVSETSEMPPNSISDALQSGIDEIQKYVGGAVITEVAGAGNTDALKVRVLRRAQQYLALREILLQVWTRVRGGGLIEVQRDENANATNKFTSFADTEKRRAQLRFDALELIEPYSVAVIEEVTRENAESGNVPVQMVW